MEINRLDKKDKVISFQGAVSNMVIDDKWKP